MATLIKEYTIYKNTKVGIEITSELLKEINDEIKTLQFKDDVKPSKELTEEDIIKIWNDGWGIDYYAYTVVVNKPYHKYEGLEGYIHEFLLHKFEDELWDVMEDSDCYREGDEYIAEFIED